MRGLYKVSTQCKYKKVGNQDLMNYWVASKNMLKRGDLREGDRVNVYQVGSRMKTGFLFGQ